MFFTKLMIMIKRILTFALLLFVATQNAQAQTDACDGLSGKAFGICNAATTAGNACDIDSSTNSCTRLATRYEELTGQTPPWLGPIITCPDTLTSNGYWYQTSPSFENATEINMLATFTNATSFDMRYSNTEPPQVWSAQNIEVPPIIYTYTPNNVDIPPGGTFVVDLTVDVSGLSSTEYAFAFRPIEVNTGITVEPSLIPLQTVSFSCN